MFLTIVTLIRDTIASPTIQLRKAEPYLVSMEENSAGTCWGVIFSSGALVVTISRL